MQTDRDRETETERGGQLDTEAKWTDFGPFRVLLSFLYFFIFRPPDCHLGAAALFIHGNK